MDWGITPFLGEIGEPAEIGSKFKMRIGNGSEPAFQFECNDSGRKCSSTVSLSLEGNSGNVNFIPFYNHQNIYQIPQNCKFFNKKRRWK
jgi:hypothetical protein